MPDYLGSIDAGIEGMRIGLDEAYCSEGVDSRVTAMVMQAADVLRGRGRRHPAHRLPPMPL